MKLVGLSGKSKSGKSTLAKYLESEYGWHRVSLANSLKLMVRAHFGLSAEQVYGEAKDSPCGYFHSDGITPRTPRDILIWMGLAYRQVDPDYWIKQVSDEMRDDKINVIDDIRFVNEADWVVANGGLMLRLERDIDLRGGDINDQSETALDNYQFHARIPESWNYDAKDIPGLATRVEAAYANFGKVQHYMEGVPLDDASV
jgi:hypothetical protein